jgi:hypothetical protein
LFPGAEKEAGPPGFPCEGLTGGVFPVPAAGVAAPEAPPPPDPPEFPTLNGAGPAGFDPPPPPPALVIVENEEGLPELEALAPPAPTTTGYAVTESKLNFVPPGKDVLKPPAPPPPPYAKSPPAPPPATTR